MKKILFMMLIASASLAQKSITIDSVSPNPFCFNDRVKVYTHSTGTWNGGENVGLSNNNGSAPLHPGTYQNLFDSNFVWSFTAYQGWFSVGGDYLVIWAGIYPVTINNCFNGIESYNASELPTSTQYFNMLGRPIEKPEGITVEVKIFSDGRKQVRKIITY